MSKNEYFVEEYDDGELVNTTDFDDFNSALKFYAVKWKWGYSARLFRNIIDLDGNIIKTEQFEYTWKRRERRLEGMMTDKQKELLAENIRLQKEIERISLRNQLTISKSIADELDRVFAGIDATDLGYVLDQTGPYGSRAFNDYYFKNKNIIALYLAGKALGVDLVKVV